MTAAITSTQADNGRDVTKAALALAIAGACIGLLIFLFTPIQSGAANGASEPAQLHWRQPAGDGAAKLIPV